MALVSFGFGDRLAGWLVTLGTGYQAYLRGTVLTNSSGTEIGTAGNPLITAGTGGTSAMTQAEFIAALKSGTCTFVGAVNSSLTSATLAASDATTKGLGIMNTDANALLIDPSGGTASATRHLYRVLQGGMVIMDAGYTGAVTGVWEGDGSGAALVYRYTA